MIQRNMFSQGSLILLLLGFPRLIHCQTTIPPQLNVATADVRVRAGETAVLTCVVDYLGAHQLTWHKGQNTVLAVDEKLIYSDRRMAVGRPSIRTWELRIQNTTRRDAGEYFCVINSRDLPSGKISLVVEEPARIVSSPQPLITVDEFETFKLICNATGFPRPRVEWFRLNGNDEMKISENFGEILLFINVTRDCFGRYRCRASNGVGISDQRDIEVSVIAKPVVMVDPENIGRERGSKVQVDCSISGHPIQWAGWFLRGELLTNGGTPPEAPPLRRPNGGPIPDSGLPGDVRHSQSNRHRIEWLGRSSAYRAVLRLTIDPLLNDADFGSYTCAATDGRSFTANASFYLWEKSSPSDGMAEAESKANIQDGNFKHPSIIIDSEPPSDPYIVEPTQPPKSVFETPQQPKIADEIPPESTRNDVIGDYDESDLSAYDYSPPSSDSPVADEQRTSTAATCFSRSHLLFFFAAVFHMAVDVNCLPFFSMGRLRMRT